MCFEVDNDVLVVVHVSFSFPVIWPIRIPGIFLKQRCMVQQVLRDEYYYGKHMKSSTSKFFGRIPGMASTERSDSEDKGDS